MKYRRTAATTTAVAIAVAGVVGVPRPAAAASRQIAVCQNRACILVLNVKYDSDGDGVTDIDEQQFGTDPHNVKSLPSAAELLDAMAQHRLLSFEQHRTEVVEIPTVTPDGTQIATGLGGFLAPAGHKGRLEDSFTDTLAAMENNGVDTSFGVTALIPGAKTSDVSAMASLAWSIGGMASPVGDGLLGVGGFGGQGHQGGGTMTSVSGGTGASADYTATSSGRSSMTYGYSTPTGHQVVTTYQGNDTAEGNGSRSTTLTASFDTKGVETQFTAVELAETTLSDGSTQQTLQVTTTYFKDGSPTGSSSYTAVQTISEDGQFYTLTETTVDVDGNKTTTTTACLGEDCDTSSGLIDPDYVTTGPITAADMNLVAARLNATRTPGPDDGSDPVTSPPPTLGKTPTIALFDPDGVTVLAAGTTPSFNFAAPDYDPRLDTLGEISGQPVPHNNGGTISWGP